MNVVQSRNKGDVTYHVTTYRITDFKHEQ